MTAAAAVMDAGRIRTFRWVFYISALQFSAFFLVPAFIYPTRLLLHIEIIAALTLGLVPSLYFMLVNLAGIFLDRSRRALHVGLVALLGLYFLWAAVSWAEIEHMDYLLR